MMLVVALTADFTSSLLLFQESNIAFCLHMVGADGYPGGRRLRRFLGGLHGGVS